jgi:6-phosphogluconolactonase
MSCFSRRSLYVGLIAGCLAILTLNHVLLAAPAPPAPKSLWVYIGTYTRGDSQGVYLARLDMASGKLSAPKLVAEVSNPSFLAIHPGGKFLYTVNEDAKFKDQKSGGVSAFSIAAGSGQLTPINQQPSRGTGPCHIVVDRAGKNVLVANYGGGSVASLPIRDDGGLKPASSFVQHTGSSILPRQKGPHAHSINVDKANRFAVVADLGLDKLLVYRFDAAKGTLAANNPPATKLTAGAAPRHFDFHPSGRFAYVINEANLTITALAYDAERGILKVLQTVPTLPKGVEKRGSTAQIIVHPSGRFVYGSNRGHDSIVAYAIDPSTGRLTYISHQKTLGETPRNFNIDPSGRYLLACNQKTHTIYTFAIDPKTGLLKPTGHKIEVPSPVCVQFMKPRG